MGVTPLLVAVSSGKPVEYIDLLLSYSVSADVYDNRGYVVVIQVFFQEGHC